ncbi:nuclear transport factor 2 family protein [Mycobacterium yunnanensis]|uniref:Nuclear transport factor 2 family protein n=1 Tax=Mycobacterium yunnanensis TaxID=368477 RepID=A0A9X3C212_9MYCO|nr:nuclear transport factor 2 family protein [Mycobacterium yunnanensis]MCV7419647.1 nuclear transport factor 2 family protein [Mycobacterium yunnanensis]
MPSAELMKQNVHRYLELVGEAKADDIAELYADDATVEDPVGGEVHIGRTAIHNFYSGMLGLKAETEVITLRALGHEAAYLWALIIDGGEGGKTRLEILSVMAFDGDGKITAMKAYWGPENFSQV